MFRMGDILAVEYNQLGRQPVGTGTVHRVTRMLAELAAAKGKHISVSALAGKLELPMPTVHRLLQLFFGSRL